MHLLSNIFSGTNDLIKSIVAEDWESVKTICQINPQQAHLRTLRRGFFDGEHDSYVMPIHQAVALKPPADALDAIIQAYPQGVLCKESSFKRLPLHIALQSADSCQVVRLLLGYAPDGAAERDVLDRIPLHYACSNGASLATIKSLLAAYPPGAKACDLHYWLPLHVACFYGANYDVIATLVSAYPGSTSDKTEKGSTALKLIYKIQCKDRDRIMSLLLSPDPAHYHDDGTDSRRSQSPPHEEVWRKTIEHPRAATAGVGIRRRHPAISA
mmetsp:Transcript_20728/g.24954  ORF Transcript_20728/g.24954 Transcript_20728/m.24954 type:complete len:270 (+) Transcript_20728:219-1028(+)